VAEPAPLAGVRILITRPQRQAEPLASAIRQQGGQAMLLPLIDIRPPRHPERIDEFLGHLDRFDLAIFISPNAVEQALSRLPNPRHAWPAKLAIAATGAGTAQALARHGLEAAVVPRDRFDSEGLLAEPSLHSVRGQNVLILRGEGGRELLAETLRARGATVEYAECYRRAAPAYDPRAIALLQPGAINIAVYTSGEAIDNLLALYGENARRFLQQVPALVVSERLIERLRSFQPESAPRVSRPNDADLLAALRAWRAGQKTL